MGLVVGGWISLTSQAGDRGLPLLLVRFGVTRAVHMLRSISRASTPGNVVEAAPRSPSPLRRSDGSDPWTVWQWHVAGCGGLRHVTPTKQRPAAFAIHPNCFYN